MDQSDAARFRRECENRTFSERQLDKYILKAERQEKKKEISNQEDKILKKMVLDKTSMFNKNKINKEKQEFQEPQKITKDIEVQQNQDQQPKQQEQPQQQQQNSVQIKDAIIKVYKHLENDQKSLKAIQMLYKLVLKYNHQLSLAHRLDILCHLFQNRKNFVKRPDTRKLLKDIHEIIIREPKFNEIFEKQLKILNIFFIDYMSLETDDTFHFSSVIKKYNENLDSIPQDQIALKEQPKIINQEQQKEEKQNDNENEQGEDNNEEIQQKTVLSIRDKLNKKKQEQLQLQQQKQKQEEEIVFPEYEYEKSELCQKLLTDREAQLDIKIQAVFDMFRDVLQYYKHQWARPSINQLMSDTYHNKRYCLPESYQEQMHDIADRWVELKNSDTASIAKRNQLDGSIGVAGFSKNEIKDGRSTRLIFDNGANTWGNKQNGL